MDRRNFIKTATVAAAGSVSSAGAQSTHPDSAARRPESPNMIYRELGRTGERVSAIGLGGFHLGKQQDPNESIRADPLPQSIAVLRSWITAGTITTASARCGWARLSAMVTGRRFS